MRRLLGDSDNLGCGVQSSIIRRHGRMMSVGFLDHGCLTTVNRPGILPGI